MLHCHREHLIKPLIKRAAILRGFDHHRPVQAIHFRIMSQGIVDPPSHCLIAYSLW